ncbi:MAG: hypothetical protein AAGD09_10085 [Cyanobacteria bacterium P01_F01_bin.56]
MELLLMLLVMANVETAPVNQSTQDCDLAYPSVCIPSPPPDLDCGDISESNFRVYLSTDSDVPSDLTDFDPHRFDGDDDGIGCESR